MKESTEFRENEPQFRAARAAVLVVDMLNDFLEEGGAMVFAQGRALYESIQRLVDAAHEAEMRVFWLNESLHPEDKLIEKRGVKCIAGTWGAQIVSALQPEPEDVQIPKRRYSGFFQTDLDLYLREFGIKHVIVTGIATNICVRSTVHDAFFLGYDVIVPADCVAATAMREQESSLWDIETHYGRVTSLDWILSVLECS
jgi:ureidoacrylate peracid hydrolase